MRTEASRPPVRTEASRPPGHRGSARGIRLLSLLLALVVSACAGLSTTSEVRPGLDLTAPEDNRIQVNFPPPVPGASIEQIARGFIRAGLASGGDYTSAKQFLTSEVARSWAPDGEIVVVASGATIEVSPPTDGRAQVRAEALAQIGTDGRYTTLATRTPQAAEMAFTQVEGEWRISQLPEGFGRWIPADDLPRLMRPFSVHYVASDRRALIEDVRWLPLDHLPSRLARAQLRPVPADLLGVATTAVAPGTRLTADSVTVVSGVATVDLTARPSTDQRLRENLWAQFVATLSQDPTVIGVIVQVGGATLELTGRPTPVTAPGDVGFPETPTSLPVPPLVRRGDQLFVFDPDAAISGRDPDKDVQEPAPGHPQIPASLTDLALNRDGTEIAAVVADRDVLTRWRGGKRYDTPYFAGALGAPTYSETGLLWVGGLAPTGSSVANARLWVIDALTDPTDVRAGTPRAVPVEWLNDRRVVESVVSPDGERLAVLSTTDSGSLARVDVAGILRDTEGRPSGLAQPMRLSDGLVGVHGLAWLTPTTLATLARDPTAESTRPYVLGLGGDRTALAALEGAEQIISTGGSRGIQIVTDKGQVFSRAGAQWLASGNGTDVLVAAR